MMHTGTATPIPIAAPVESPSSLDAVCEGEVVIDVPKESVWMVLLGFAVGVVVVAVVPQSVQQTVQILFALQTQSESQSS